MHRMRAFAAMVAALAISMAAAPLVAQSLPAPEQYLGFRVGTDRKLATWPQVVEYMHMAARASDRVRVEELGKSTNGHPFLLLTISSPKNLARIEQIKAEQKRLAYPYELSEKEAEEIAARNPAVILITLTIHSTEIGSTQMSLELVHRLATENSPYIQRILDNVVFLLAPSVNPDGQVLVIDWYNKNVGTDYEYSPMPWLYHPYTGHDDNRDAYMLTQKETQYVTKVLYKDWFPLVFLDEHQMGSGGARIFVPPFVDPPNPNIDPAVMAGANLIGMRMFNALHQAGKEGVSYGERFTWWWQGSAKNGAWYHNMIGLLTEVASTRMASPIEQRRAGARDDDRDEGSRDAGSARGRDPRRPLAPPSDTWPRTNYPRPWLGGTWKLRDIVDYELIVTYALLEGAADDRTKLQRNFYQLNRKAIETGRKGGPFAYVLPPEQHDPGAVYKLLDLLDDAGVEIYRANEAFEAGGRKFDAGSYVIPMGQPFRNYAKDLLEPQRYPMRPTAPGQAPERPYDVAGWTLPLQMGVDAVRVDQPFDVKYERVSPIPAPKSDLVPAKRGGAGFIIAPGPNSKALLTNRLLKAGADVSWTPDSVQASARGWTYPVGSLYVKGVAAEKLHAVAAEMGLVGEQLTQAEENAIRGNLMRLSAPRIALYQPWTGLMDEGWTRWLLEQYEFPYTTLHNADIQAGQLSDKFDVI
ncbi:MAG: M14 family metallopeptidase, partial [Candidatus Acidiferrales bacterium]